MPCVLHFHKDGDEMDSCADGDSENYSFFVWNYRVFFWDMTGTRNWGKQVCTLIWKSFGGMESEPMLTQGKNPPYGENSPQRRMEPMTVHQAGQWAQHTTHWAIAPPHPAIIKQEAWKLVLQWLSCQAPGVIGSALELFGPVSVSCDWVRWQVWSAASISVWQHIELSEQIRPWGAVACCWDVKQSASNESVSAVNSGLQSGADVMLDPGLCVLQSRQHAHDQVFQDRACS